MRIGFGYDFHRLIEGRKLIVGGVQLDWPLGPEAHSDGDFLVHAIVDAVLGAIGRSDIGTHFPDWDEQWRGARSVDFLLTLRGMLAEDGYSVGNIDANIVLERPKLSPHFEAMRHNIAGALGIDPAAVNVKANTHEGVGEIGEGRAACAMAVVLLEKS